MSERTMTKLALTIIVAIVVVRLLWTDRTVYVPDVEYVPSPVQVTVVEPVVEPVVVAAPAAPAKAAKPAKVKTPRIPRVPGLRVVHHVIRL